MSSEKTETKPQPEAAAAPDVSLQLLTFLEVYKKQIFIGIIVAAVVATFGYAYAANQKKKEKAAATALAMVGLNTASRAGGEPVEPKPDELFKVAGEFAGTTAAEQAALRGAVALFETAKYADAQKKFEEFLAQFPESAHKGTAELGIAASLEALKQFDPAVQAYQKVISGYGTESAGTQAKLGLGSVYEQKGQPEQALKLYEEVALVRPGTAPSGWASEAMTRKERLLASHPELAAQAAKAAVPAPALPGVPAVTVPAKK